MENSKCETNLLKETFCNEKQWQTTPFSKSHHPSRALSLLSSVAVWKVPSATFVSDFRLQVPGTCLTLAGAGLVRNSALLFRLTINLRTSSLLPRVRNASASIGELREIPLEITCSITLASLLPGDFCLRVYRGSITSGCDFLEDVDWTGHATGAVRCNDATVQTTGEIRFRKQAHGFADLVLAKVAHMQGEVADRV